MQQSASYFYVFLGGEEYGRSKRRISKKGRNNKRRNQINEVHEHCGSD